MKVAKRFLSALLSLCLVLGMLPGTAWAASGGLPFTDVNPTDWFYDAVQYVYEKGMMSGTSDTTFTPGGTTTRGMIVTTLHRMEGAPVAAGGAFSDVPAGQWYSSAVAWASANKIVDGYGNGLFGPDNAITREQMAAILYRYAQYKGYDTSAAGSAAGYSDAAQVSSFAAAPMNWAIGGGLISGVDGNRLAPNGDATRAQVATILMRFCESAVPAGQTEPAPEPAPEPEAPVEKTYTVTFDLNYGQNDPHAVKTVPSGETVDQPSKPSRSGYSFGGWYTAPSGGSLFDFKKEITADLTLYAHWTKNSSGGSHSGGSFYPVAPARYTVKFVANGGSEVPSQQVAAGGYAVRPSDPFLAGFVFDGWYRDSELTVPFTFNEAVRSNITLYAKWTPAGPDDAYRVAFDANDGSAGVYHLQAVLPNETATRPERDPQRELYAFTGWYLEPAAVTPYDFSTPVVSDLTLYAGWGSPDGDTEGTYSASNTLETIYSVSGVEVTGNSVTVTYNTGSMALLGVEFIEDEMGVGDWSEEGLEANLAAAPFATAAGYTEEYGELATATFPIDGPLPDYYWVRVTMSGYKSTGEALDVTPYVSAQYTEAYAQFDQLTTNDFDEDLVIDFDGDSRTNFGVLKESVLVVPTGSLDRFEVADVAAYDENGVEELVPDHEFIFSDPYARLEDGRTVSDLQAGDIVYLAGTTWLFKIKTVGSKADGSIFFTQDKDAVMTDFYDTLKVDLEGRDPNSDLRWEIIDVDASVSGSFNPSVSKTFSNGVTLTGSIAGKITGRVKMFYDAHLFSADYFECAVTFETEVSAEVKADVSTDNTNEWKNVVYQFDTSGIRLPTPVTGLEIYAKPSAKLDWELSGSVSVKLESKQTSGFKYNTDTGRTDIKEKENKVSIMAEGKAEVKVGPNIDVGVQLLGGVLNAGVTAEAGAKFTATAETGADDLTNTVESKHACALCVSGEANWYATAAVKCGYKITDSLKGDIAKVTILDIENPIMFGSFRAKFFVSVLNSLDSPFGGAVTLGGGECTNKTYRTEFRVHDENDQLLTDIPVTVARQGQTSVKSGASPYVVYLYAGPYKASATIDGVNVEKTVAVSGGRQTVILQVLSADSVMEGTIVDANDHSIPIQGASIKVTKGDVVVASVASDSSGKFSVPVPDGALQVNISKEGYLPFSSTETVYDNEIHSMGLVEMTPGSGMGGFHGVIRDATNNQPLSGVTLKLYNGWSNEAEPNTALRTLTTDGNGAFRYDTVTLFGKVLGLPSGNYTLTASKEGYADTSYNIVIYPGATDENPAINETMSPAMNDGYYRIVLTWGQTPSDLDSHLVANTDTGDMIHVFYSQKNPSPFYANLDVDDTTSYGPETITITNFEGLSGIRYAVHDYTNRSATSSTAMSYSNAIVRVFKGSELLRTFVVPTGYGGTEWDVFTLDSNGRITTVNSMSYTYDPTDVLASGRYMFENKEPLPPKDYELEDAAEEEAVPPSDGPQDTDMEAPSEEQEREELVPPAVFVEDEAGSGDWVLLPAEDDLDVAPDSQAA